MMSFNYTLPNNTKQPKLTANQLDNVSACACTHAYSHTHAQKTDGQVEYTMPLVAHNMGGLSELSVHWSCLYMCTANIVKHPKTHTHTQSFSKQNSVSQLLLKFFNSNNNLFLSGYAFSVLTLLVGGRKGIRPVKNWVVGCWRGYLSGARCRLAYGPADASTTHCLLLQ